MFNTWPKTFHICTQSVLLWRPLCNRTFHTTCCNCINKLVNYGFLNTCFSNILPLQVHTSNYVITIFHCIMFKQRSKYRRRHFLSLWPYNCALFISRKILHSLNKKIQWDNRNALSFYFIFLLMEGDPDRYIRTANGCRSQDIVVCLVRTMKTIVYTLLITLAVAAVLFQSAAATCQCLGQPVSNTCLLYTSRCV